MNTRPLLQLSVIVLILGALLLGGALVAATSSTAAPLVAPALAGWRSGGPFIPGSSPPTPLYVHAVAASPAFGSDQTLFAATRGGLFRTIDGGQSWQIMVTLPAVATESEFTRVSVSADYAAQPVVIAAAYDASGDLSTLIRSSDGGGAWTTIATLAGRTTALALSPDYAHDSTLFALVGDGLQLHRSNDGGLTWSQHLLAPADEYYNGFGLALSPAFASDQTIFVTGFGTVHRSTDRGETWTALSTYGLTFGLAVSPDFALDQTVWASYRFMEGSGLPIPEASVIRSLDAGATWITDSIGLPGAYEPFPRVIAVSPGFASDHSVFTALSGFPLGYASHSLFRSYDQGDTWVDLGAAPGDPDVRDLVITAAPGDVRAHLATEAGVWSYGGGCDERLVNGSMEADAGWNFPITPYRAGYSSQYSHGAARSLRTGIVIPGDNVRSYSSAQQTILLPTNAGSLTLHAWWRPLSGEGDLPVTAASEPEAVLAAAAGVEPAAPASDRQYALLLDIDGNILERMLWTRSNANAWRELSYDLTAHAGQTVRIHFGSYNDGINGVTSLFVDDVSLTHCAAQPPPEHLRYFPLLYNQVAPTATPTPVVTSLPPTSTPTATPSPTPTATAEPPTAEPEAWPTPYLAETLSLGLRPRGIALDASGAHAYLGMVAVDGKGVIGLVQTEPLSLTGEIALGATSSSINDVALRRDGRILFAAEREAGVVAAVDLLSRTVVSVIPAGLLPNGMTLQANRGYVANFGSNSVTAFDTTTFSVTDTILTVGVQPSLFAAESWSGAIIPDLPGSCCASSRMFWLSAHGSDQVITFLDGAPVQITNAMTDAYGLALDSGSRRLYVAHRGPTHKISIIDIATDLVVGVIYTADKEPYGLAVNPESGHLFVAVDDQVRVYRTLDGAPVAAIAAPGVNADSRLALDRTHDRIYVTSFGSQKLYVIQDRWPPLVLVARGAPGYVQIYAMLPDGSEMVQLTNDSSPFSTLPVGSPDGRWIAFARASFGAYQIWLMDRDGHHAVPLTEGPWMNKYPTWSPDGAKLAFASDRSGAWNIHLLSLADGSTVQLTHAISPTAVFNTGPKWSWANGRIVFMSNRSGDRSALFSMKADGSDVQQLTNDAVSDYGWPSWSASGLNITFWSMRPPNTIFVMNADGTGIAPIASPWLHPGSPVWSPNGEFIIFPGKPDLALPTSELYRLRPDGSELVKIGSGLSKYDPDPGWLPGR